MTLTAKQRADLRARAHHLAITVHVGHQGVSAALQQTLDDALRTKELVKVQFSKNADVKAKAAANDLAALVNADVVQSIGRTATLFRDNPALRKGR